MKLCVSSSVLPFRAKAEKVWGLRRYQWPRDMFDNAVFFGMYHEGDYFHFLRHFGKKIIFWCGSDILALKRKKWPVILLKSAEHYCENGVEWDGLREMGISAKVGQSFLEDVNDFPVSYKWKERPVVYISSRKGNEEAYGVGTIDELRREVPEVEFRVFDGTTNPDKFNEEIKNYQCGLRLNEHDGFSEIIGKSALMGQWPISRIPYPLIDSYKTKEQLIRLLKDLPNKKRPNYEASNYWKTKLNDLPFLDKEK